MRRGKRIASVLLAAALLTVSALTPMETKAGNSELVLDGETLETSDWNNPEGDVVIEEQKLVFPEESTDYTRFIAKSPIKAEEKSTTLVTLSATMNIKKMPQGKSFILGFGLTSIESLPGEAGNIEVAFTNNGGIKVGITVYDDEGNAEALVAAKSCGVSLNKDAKVNVQITTDSKIAVSVNNTAVCSATLPVSGEGRVGFLQTGECSAVLSDIELIHYEYDRPENTNVSEDFEKGAMDTSKLTAKMLWAAANSPMGQVVEDYNGNQVLMHKNVGASYIGTLYQYSNFEMTFDVPYYKLTKEYDTEGTLLSAGFDKFIVSLGSERADWDGLKWDMSAEAVVFEKGTVYSNSNKDTYSVQLTKNPWAEEVHPFSVKVAMVDSVLTIGMKWLEEESFETVLTYKLRGGTPTGYIQIWSLSGANFAIDNLTITNLDDEPNVIETEYKSGKLVVPEGNAPEALERVYAEVEEKGTSWYLLIPAAAIVGGAALLITALATRGKKKESEVAKNEQ